MGWRLQMNRSPPRGRHWDVFHFGLVRSLLAVSPFELVKRFLAVTPLEPKTPVGTTGPTENIDCNNRGLTESDLMWRSAVPRGSLVHEGPLSAALA